MLVDYRAGEGTCMDGQVGCRLAALNSGLGGLGEIGGWLVEVEAVCEPPLRRVFRIIAAWIGFRVRISVISVNGSSGG